MDSWLDRCCTVSLFIHRASTSTKIMYSCYSLFWGFFCCGFSNDVECYKSMSFCRFKLTSGTLVNLTIEFYGSCVFLSIGDGIKWSSLKGKEQLGKTFQKRSINCVLVFLYKLFILNQLLHSRQRQPNMESNYRWTGDPHRVVRLWRPDCDLLEIRGVPESDSPNTVTAVKQGF